MSRIATGLRAALGAVLLVALLVAGPDTARAQVEAAGPEAPKPAAAAAGPGADSGLAAAGWLAGCWLAQSPDGRNAAEEHWMTPRGGLMVGMSRTIRGGEARSYELLTIREEDGRLVYHAVPSGQAPTDFPARLVEDSRLEFVNSEHDFPRKIVYTRTGDDQIEAAVFGEVDGSVPAFVVPYERIGCPD